MIQSFLLKVVLKLLYQTHQQLTSIFHASKNIPGYIRLMQTFIDVQSFLSVFNFQSDLDFL